MESTVSNNPPTLTHLPATAAVDRQIGNMDAMDAINTHVYTYIFLPYHSRGQGQKSNILETGEQCVPSSNGQEVSYQRLSRTGQKGEFLDWNIEMNIHPPSYPYMVGNIFDAAERIGFEILGDIKEVRIDNE
ncbi:hypothetical protein I7I51_08890 [Histoplasma capsulatum]|uniref:Uncharacterized protein n=1 Tax=Ajellomyces capsulatus TaxID=5037 RepID=A0A8A1M1J9_AJECA|nr:hypothetical protein I7I51_08890 [Histoplasma capsulatum]